MYKWVELLSCNVLKSDFTFRVSLYFSSLALEFWNWGRIYKVEIQDCNDFLKIHIIFLNDVKYVIVTVDSSRYMVRVNAIIN